MEAKIFKKSAAKFSVKRTRDKKGKINEILISMNKSLWFDMEIKIRTSMGGIIGNWSWAKQSLKLKDKSDSCRNDYYDSSGEVNVKWRLKEWSIGHPEADFYRTWLNAISERLKNHFDWNLKVKTLHIEAPFLND